MFYFSQTIHLCSLDLMLELWVSLFQLFLHLCSVHLCKWDALGFRHLSDDWCSFEDECLHPRHFQRLRPCLWGEYRDECWCLILASGTSDSHAFMCPFDWKQTVLGASGCPQLVHKHSCGLVRGTFLRVKRLHPVFFTACCASMSSAFVSNQDRCFAPAQDQGQSRI